MEGVWTPGLHPERAAPGIPGPNERVLLQIHNDVTRFLGGQSLAAVRGQGYVPPAVREARLKEEIDRLNEELKGALDLRSFVAKKRPRSLGPDDDHFNFPPAVPEPRAEALRLELERERAEHAAAIRAHTAELGEVTAHRDRLLRELKFLAREEEEARRQLQARTAEHTAAASEAAEALRREQETSRRLESEVTQLRFQVGELRQQHVSSGHSAAKEARQEALAAAQATARAVQDNARLQAEVGRLKAELGAAARRVEGTPSEATAVAALERSKAAETEARKLRQSVRELERALKRRGEDLKAMELDRENVAALHLKIEDMQADNERCAREVREARDSLAEVDALRLERQAWLDVFSEYLSNEEEPRRTEGGAANEPSRGAGASASASASDGARETAAGAKKRPSPLDVMVHLRRQQQAAKELRAKAADAERRLALLKGRADAAEQRALAAERSQREAEARVSRAEQEAARAGLSEARYQRENASLQEFIRAYEIDLKAARAVAEPESGGYSSSAGGAPVASAVEAASSTRTEGLERQLRGMEETAQALRLRVQELERSLEDAQKERDSATRRLEAAERELAAAERSAARGDFDPAVTRVLRFTDNPSTLLAQQRSKHKMEAELAKSRAEVEALRVQLQRAKTAAAEGGSADGVDSSKLNQRLKAMFREQIQCYREAVYLLTGYKVDMTTDREQPQLRLRSMYAESPGDYLLFQAAGATLASGLRLMETPLALTLQDKVAAYLDACGSLPAFLSSVTLDLFDRSTFQGPG